MITVPCMMNHLFDFKAKASYETIFFPAKGITQKTGNVKEKMPLSLLSLLRRSRFRHKKGTEGGLPYLLGRDRSWSILGNAFGLG